MSSAYVANISIPRLLIGSHQDELDLSVAYVAVPAS
jgi:hypothetical protein